MARSHPPNRLETHRPPEETTARDATDVETLYACPLCGGSTDSSSDLYVHLQISHRKSALAGLVLDVSDCTVRHRSTG